MDGFNPCQHTASSSSPWVRFAVTSLLLLGAGGLIAEAQETMLMAPPPPPLTVAVAPLPARAPLGPEGGQLFSIGNPSNDEQFYLELINRARANPPVEGLRLAALTDPNILAAYSAFGINLILMETQFALLLPSPPLSMNATLTAVAKAHSQNMLQYNYQGHNGPDGDLVSRFQTYISGANGYTLGENVYAYSKSVAYGHAGFEVDWGGPIANGGMQSPPGHRINIHNADFREVGIGVVAGSNGGSGGVGPQLVTQDFGSVGGLLPFVTGVVYRDLNGNGFYDPGEGVGGVTVNVSNANYYAVTASAGGYSVPVPGNGSYVVTFSGGSAPTYQKNVSVAGGQNVKADYVVTGFATPTPTPSPSSAPLLANISTRAVVGINENILIGGFIVTGTEAKKVIIRGIGPSLSLSGKMLDPTIELHDSTGAPIGFNDDWSQGENSQEINESGLAPADPSESAIVVSLAPGPYTAVLRGANQTIGTAVVEVYDLDYSANSKLANISTRASVQSGDFVLIGGLIVAGESEADVIVRAIGPSLPVSGALADPNLELRNSDGALLASNDNWRSTQQTAISQTGLAPAADAESAILVSLSPGAYTAIVRGANGTTGVAVVEVYQLN